MQTINIDDLASAIVQELQVYSQDITDGIKEGIEIVSKEVNEEIKKHVTFKQPSGKYVKAFRIKTSYEDKCNKRNTWFVANGQYRLTHLLENGHALRNGGRSKAYKHIKFGEELAIKRMEEIAKGAIEDANGR